MFPSGAEEPAPGSDDVSRSALFTSPGVQLHAQYSASACRQYSALYSTIFCTHNILEQNTLFIIHKHRRSSMTKSFRNARVNISSKVMGKHVKSIRYRFYHRFMLPLECWNPVSRTPSAASGLGLCILHPQCSRRSYARALCYDIVREKKSWRWLGIYYVCLLSYITNRHKTPLHVKSELVGMYLVIHVRASSNMLTGGPNLPWFAKT